MLGSREKNLVHFRGVFAPRIDRFLGEGPFPKIEGRSLNSGKSFSLVFLCGCTVIFVKNEYRWRCSSLSLLLKILKKGQERETRVSIDGTSTREELLKVSRRFPGQRKDYQKM